PDSVRNARPAATSSSALYPRPRMRPTSRAQPSGAYPACRPRSPRRARQARVQSSVLFAWKRQNSHAAALIATARSRVSSTVMSGLLAGREGVDLVGPEAGPGLLAGDNDRGLEVPERAHLLERTGVGGDVDHGVLDPFLSSAR